MTAVFTHSGIAKMTTPSTPNSVPTPLTYRDEMRSKMLGIAKRVVAEEGLGALQARRVADEAGCAVGTIYNVFKNLDNLIIETNSATLSDLGASLVAVAQKGASITGPGAVAERLQALGLAYLDFAVSQNKSWRAVFDHHMAPGNPVPDWYRQKQAQLFALVEQVLGAVITDETSRSRAARALFSAVHGVVMLSLAGTLGPTDRSETEAQVRFIVQAVAEGVAHADV
jgi:AcrR family transcriptional regulator